MSLVTSAAMRSEFFPARQNRLKMWRLLLGGDDADFDFLETGGFEPAVQIAFGKTQPAVAVKFARLVEVVLEQIEQQNLAVRFQQFRRARECRRRVGGVVQGLAQDHEVNAVRFNRRILQIALPEFEIFQAVLFRLGRAEGDDFFRVVHGDDFFAAAREQFAQQTFARAQIGDDQRWQNPQQQMSKRLPRPARSINAVEAAGDLIEEDLRLLFAARKDALQIDLVAAVFGEFLRAANRELDEFAGDRVGLRIEFVKGALAFAPRFHERAIREQTEVRRDARLDRKS